LGVMRIGFRALEWRYAKPCPKGHGPATDAELAAAVTTTARIGRLINLDTMRDELYRESVAFLLGGETSA
jgi:hypothetical protein